VRRRCRRDNASAAASSKGHHDLRRSDHGKRAKHAADLFFQQHAGHADRDGSGHDGPALTRFGSASVFASAAGRQ
jgi:hypothetical protein